MYERSDNRDETRFPSEQIAAKRRFKNINWFLQRNSPRLAHSGDTFLQSEPIAGRGQFEEEQSREII
jgi:hypothetical protein